MWRRLVFSQLKTLTSSAASSSSSSSAIVRPSFSAARRLPSSSFRSSSQFASRAFSTDSDASKKNGFDREKLLAKLESLDPEELGAKLQSLNDEELKEFVRAKIESLGPEEVEELGPEFKSIAVNPIATGHELEELKAELQGKDLLEINYPEGPFGTKESPAIVQSYYDKRIVGCPGGGGEDEHDVVWFWLEKDKPFECPVCTQYFKLEVVGPGGDPEGHDDEDHH